ncbi:MAG: type II secretion system F family protein [Nanoarchaeota archaeon]|nr:type II secretion system F family protein [Nanoarchaeota archaeon]
MKIKKRQLTKIEKARIKRIIIISVILALFISSAVLLFYKSILGSGLSFIMTIVVIFAYFYFKDMLSKSSRIKRIEDVFPDFLQLMSSNLRAGMTIDRAMLLSSRPEFYPLDIEILKTGKDIATNKDIEIALIGMGQRISSEKINKTLLLIISGIRAGGNLSILLEETSANMKEKDFVEKKAYSNVLMYVIFIFLVVAIFAPGLFSLSNVLVEVLTKILSGIPEMDTSTSSTFTLSKVNISISFIRYFSITFMITIGILASLILGLVSKGEEKEGIKYIPPILILSLTIFFLVKMFILRFLTGFI